LMNEHEGGLTMAHVVDTEQTGSAIKIGRLSLAGTVEAGAVAGLTGGALMALVAVAHALLTGYGLLFPLRLIGATFLGAPALVGGAGVIAWGAFIHSMTSITLGIIFAATVTRRTTFAAAAAGGVIYALLVLGFMAFVITPLANPVMMERGLAAPGAYFVMHVLFGLGLAVAPLAKRRLDRATL
jgi:hypothetical protein